MRKDVIFIEIILTSFFLNVKNEQDVRGFEDLENGSPAPTWRDIGAFSRRHVGAGGGHWRTFPPRRGGGTLAHIPAAT